MLVPHFFMSQHLRVEENPILKMPHLEAASILLAGPTLKKFNDRGTYSMMIWFNILSVFPFYRFLFVIVLSLSLCVCVYISMYVCMSFYSL